VASNFIGDETYQPGSFQNVHLIPDLMEISLNLLRLNFRANKQTLRPHYVLIFVYILCFSNA
jgi:hypothetical protein